MTGLTSLSNSTTSTRGVVVGRAGGQSEEDCGGHRREEAAERSRDARVHAATVATGQPSAPERPRGR